METELKPPTQPKKLSAADEGRLQKFKALLIDDTAEHLRKQLMTVYFDFTQLIVLDASNIYNHTPTALYYIQTLIEVLE